MDLHSPNEVHTTLYLTGFGFHLPFCKRSLEYHCYVLSTPIETLAMYVLPNRIKKKKNNAHSSNRLILLVEKVHGCAKY